MDDEEVPVVKEHGQAVNYSQHIEVIASALAKTSVEDIPNAVGIIAFGYLPSSECLLFYR